MGPKGSDQALPEVGLWRGADSRLHLVSAFFPGEPGLCSDMWCYESDGIEFAGGERSAGGTLSIRHRWRDHEETVVTVVTPGPDVVDVTAHLEDPSGRWVDLAEEECPRLNLCWQLLRAPQFSSWPEPYPEFVKRCFLFTDAGLAFLDRTTRFNIPVRPADHTYNNPPWVQMYLPVWRPLIEAGPDSWAAYSTDRYTYPVIGAVSRCGRYLTAIACEANRMMCQAWHDCMHNDAQWRPLETGEAKVWRERIYLMENDPQALLQRVGTDLPGAMTLAEGRVPA